MNRNAVSQFIQSMGSAFSANDSISDSRLMEREHLATLHQIYQLLAAADYDSLGNFLTDDVELEIIGPAVVPVIGKWTGRQQVLAAIQKNFSQVKNQRPEIVNLTAQGNSIVVVAREKGESVQSGNPYDIHWVQIFTFMGGKLSRIHEVADGLDLALAFTG